MIQARDYIHHPQPKFTEGPSARKRSEPETNDMDIEKSEVSKKQKTTGGTEVIDLGMIKEPVITPTIVEEETTQTMVDTTSANSEAGNTMPPRPVFQQRKYNYAVVVEDQFKNKQSLLIH